MELLILLVGKHGELVSRDEIVANVEAHVQQAHPEMVGQMSREQVLAMAEEV